MRFIPLAAGALLLVFLAGITALNYISSNTQPLPVLGQAPAFVLLDGQGTEFDSHRLAGRNWVVNFFFTSCDGPCPIINGRVTSLARSYQGRDDPAFVSITIDPKRDTPEVLKTYKDRLGKGLDNWQLLSGTEEQTTAVLDGFKTGMPPVLEAHSTRVFLIDSKGQIRGSYSGMDAKAMRTLGRDLERLMR